MHKSRRSVSETAVRLIEPQLVGETFRFDPKKFTPLTSQMKKENRETVPLDFNNSRASL